MNDEELENLRRKRLMELRQQQMQEALDDQEAQQREIEQQRQQVLRLILTSEARERLGRIRIARPDIAEAVENQLILLAQSGRLQSKITDEYLREILSRIMPKKKDINIRRK
ncbi:MAG: DNA-binding protein [Candidatus Thermoplasmatota archaeon]